jgi:signal transduction histidine kinase
MSETKANPWWKQWRHVIMLLAVLLAAEQLRSATSAYLYYLELEQTSLGGEAGYLLLFGRHGVMGVDNENAQTRLDANFESMKEKGLRYVFIYDARRDVLIEAGEHTFDVEPREMARTGDFRPLGKHFTRDLDKRIHTDMVPKEIMGSEVADKIHFEQLSRARGDVKPPFPLPKGPPRIPAPHAQPLDLKRMPPIEIIQFVPKRTLVLRSKALSLLALGLLGAFLTFAGGFSIWWLIGKKQRAEREAEEKRMLATLGKMSAVISHELRNPLAGAKGQIELLEMMLYEDKPLQKAQQAKDELERLEELSNTLLSFVNSRRIAPASYKCAQMVDDLKSLARDKRLEVDTSQMPTEWRYDAITLVRAVDNLVSNALSFTPADGKVYLKLWEEDERLHISVRDEGPGFPADMDDMFEPFVTTRIKGTGLGMAIAAEVVRAHGGEINAQNHPDGGAFIQLWLPRSHLG